MNSLALSVALALGLGPLGSACEGASPLAERKDQPSADALGKWVDVWIPPSASGYRSFAESWQDWVVLARFELPRGELATFLDRNHLVERDAQPAPQTKQPWFAPAAAARTFTSAPTAGAPPARFAKVFWIAERGERAEVFLRATDR